MVIWKEKRKRRKLAECSKKLLAVLVPPELPGFA